MSASDIAFLALVVGAFVLFGGTLGWASWQQSRTARRSRQD